VYGDFSSGILGVNGWLGAGTQSPACPMELKTTGRRAVFVPQRSDGGAMNFMNASMACGQFGTGNGYPVRILVDSAWRMSLNLDNGLFPGSVGQRRPQTGRPTKNSIVRSFIRQNSMQEYKT
jgi:hypothetical protein